MPVSFTQNPPEWTGPLSVDQLKKPPLNTWFKPLESPKELEGDWRSKDFSALRVVLILGTWCDDSHRYVPEILHFLEPLPGFAGPEIFAVGRDKTCPFCPEGIRPEHIPLVVVYFKNQELGRMVEQPEVSVKDFFEKILNRL